MKRMENEKKPIIEMKQIIDTAVNRHRLLAELSNHIGEVNAVSMTKLYETVFDRPWHNRVNDTRPLRKLIELMRDEGIPICSVTSCHGGGYYIAAAGSEQEEYLRRDKFRALRILHRDAKMLKTTLPNYLGQLKIETEANSNG
jgi:hypothetical protein